MCMKNHDHGLIETWITPESSTRLRSKLVQLHPSGEMPEHSTGPGREEVITCIFGTLLVTIAGQPHTLTAGEAVFIPAETLHSVKNPEEDHALYCYVVNQPSPEDFQKIRIDKLFMKMGNRFSEEPEEQFSRTKSCAGMGR